MVEKNVSTFHKAGSNISKKRREGKKYRCPFIRIINKRYRPGAERLSGKSHATHGHLYRMRNNGTGVHKVWKKFKLQKLHKNWGEFKLGFRGVIIIALFLLERISRFARIF